MYYTRIYTDPNGESQFEKITVNLKNTGLLGFLSEDFVVKSFQFRENKADYSWDYHNAPVKQFIILLDGEIEITTSLGETRIFSSGEIILVEDTEGKGHKTRNIKNIKRKSIIIKL